MKGSVILLSTPFAPFTLPSLQLANISSYLKKHGFDVYTEFPCYKYAEFIGWDQYKLLRDHPIGQKIFSYLLFEGKFKIKEERLISFDQVNQLTEKTKTFFENYHFSKEIKQDTVFIFHMYHYQMISSLYFAKVLKQTYDNEIWISGFHCKGELGKNLSELFPFIDKTIGEDVEETVLDELSGTESEHSMDLNFLNSPDFDDFFELKEKMKTSIPAFKKNNVYYQVEFARGCRWDKCSFCTLNCSSRLFRTRSIKRIIDDYNHLTNKYKTSFIYPEHFIMPNDWEKWILEVSSFYKSTLKNLNLNFRVTDLLDEEKMKLLKRAEANILVGTESFSNRCLQSINKGQSVIEIIQVLKWAKRWDVPCCHNLMYGLPNEDISMYRETKQVIEYIYHLQPPFDLEKFRLTFGSGIFNDFRKYGIKKMEIKAEFSDYFPQVFLDDYIPFFYDFEVDDDRRISEHDWKKLISNWREVYYKEEYKSYPTKDPLLKICKGPKSYEIFDNRYRNICTYQLNETEGRLYDYMNQIRTKLEIEQKFNYVNADQIQDIINKLEKEKLVYIEKDKVLALAI